MPSTPAPFPTLAGPPRPTLRPFDPGPGPGPFGRLDRLRRRLGRPARRRAFKRDGPCPTRMGYKVPSDEEVLGALTRVLAREGTVETQRRLRDAVLAELHLLDADYSVTGERVRTLAVRSRYVDLEIEAGTTDRDPPKACPVCGGAFRTVKNRTLEGKVVTIQWRCTRCPYRTGEDRRVPLRYTFHAKARAVGGQPAGPFA